MKEELIIKALSLGVKYLLLTKGEDGAEVYWLDNGGLKKHSNDIQRIYK
jgi:hypothetical protein